MMDDLYRFNVDYPMYQHVPCDNGDYVLAEDALKLQAKVQELEGLLKVAKCPCCDGSGAYYDNMGEVCQCQWCYETKAALKENE